MRGVDERFLSLFFLFFFSNPWVLYQRIYSMDIVNKRICRNLHQFLNRAPSLVNAKIIDVEGKIDIVVV